MRETDREAFYALISDVHAFYSKDCSQFALGVWFEAMRPFDFPSVQRALNRHCINPDGGQFAPKPADIVKLLTGTSGDAALAAWAKVDRAVRVVGTWQSVVFDDPLIHRVVLDMGGWIVIGSKSESDWPFVAKEFESRYRGYRMRGEAGEYPRVLIGYAEAQNSAQGQPVAPPRLLGDEAAAKAVMIGGATGPLLSAKPAAVAGAGAVKALSVKA